LSKIPLFALELLHTRADEQMWNRYSSEVDTDHHDDRCDEADGYHDD